jgi:hypothetical protein
MKTSNCVVGLFEEVQKVHRHFSFCRTVILGKPHVILRHCPLNLQLTD